MPIWDLGGIGSHIGAICPDPAKIPYHLRVVRLLTSSPTLSREALGCWSADERRRFQLGSVPRRTLLACVLHALLVLLSPVYLPRVLRRCGAVCGFDDDYLFSLAVCWGAVSALLVPPLLRWVLVGCRTSVPVALVI